MLHDLIEAFRKNGCCICYLIRKRVHKYMDDFLYEQVNDVGIREQLRKSLGFCNMHAWQLQKIGDGFGQSIVYQDLFETIINKLNNIYESSNTLKTFIKELLKDKRGEMDTKIKRIVGREILDSRGNPILVVKYIKFLYNCIYEKRIWITLDKK